MDKGEFLTQTEGRLRAAGHKVAPHPGGMLTGMRSDFRLRWMAVRPHTIIVVSTADAADADGMARFSDRALEWANSRKGQLNGLQSGVAVIPVVGAEHVDASAVRFAERQLVRKFATFAWPVVVDRRDGTSASHTGRPAVGFVFNGWMRKQIAAVARSARREAAPAAQG